MCRRRPGRWGEVAVKAAGTTQFALVLLRCVVHHKRIWAHFKTLQFSGSYWRNNRSNKNRKVSEPSHSPINKAVVDFAYENWRRVMLVTLPPLKIQIRVSRPRKVAIKQWVSWKNR